MEGGTPIPAQIWPRSSPGRGWLEPVRSAIALDIVDPLVLAQKTARALHPAVGLSFTGIAIREGSGLFAMHGVAGGRNEEVLRRIRVSPGQGLGGKVVALREPVLVPDYLTDPAITTHFADLAVMESLAGMVAVPVISGGDVTAIIYAAARDEGTIGDDAVTRLHEAGCGLADLFGVAVRHQDAVRRQAAAERLRIAEELHDTVGQLLFSIGASARRLRAETEGLEGVTRLSDVIETDAGRATRLLREAFRRLAPQAPEEGLPVAMRVSVEEFSQASGVPAHLVVLGEPRTVAPDEAGALLNVVREGLHNVAKHAGASLVVVTLAFSPGSVEVAVQDDGWGLPSRFVLSPIPARNAAGGFGLPSLLRRVQQLGGTLDVRRSPQGGTILRAALRDGWGDGSAPDQAISRG